MYRRLLWMERSAAQIRRGSPRHQTPGPFYEPRPAASSSAGNPSPRTGKPTFTVGTHAGDRRHPRCPRNHLPCPAPFLLTRENTRHLTAFFERGKRVFAWAPGGDAWTPALIKKLCTDHDLIHCPDPFKNESGHGSAAYGWLRRKTGYRYRSTDQALSELRTKLKKLPPVMFNNIYSREESPSVSQQHQQ
jgi:hypothetical protein